MGTLAVDIGGTHIKLLLEGETKRRAFVSGKDITPKGMMKNIAALSDGWSWDQVSIGLPAPIVDGKPILEPYNLGGGWADFDYEAAFGCPTKLINDAAMQALGSYEGGKMLFLGLCTGLGSAMVVPDNQVLPMELGHMPYRKKGGVYEDYLGEHYLEEKGHAKWSKHVHRVVKQLQNGLQPEYIVLGGGNTKQLKELPKNCRRGANKNAFLGGYRMWDKNATMPKHIS